MTKRTNEAEQLTDEEQQLADFRASLTADLRVITDAILEHARDEWSSRAYYRLAEMIGLAVQISAHVAELRVYARLNEQMPGLVAYDRSELDEIRAAVDKFKGQQSRVMREAGRSAAALEYEDRARSIGRTAQQGPFTEGSPEWQPGDRLGNRHDRRRRRRALEQQRRENPCPDCLGNGCDVCGGSGVASYFPANGCVDCRHCDRGRMRSDGSGRHNYSCAHPRFRGSRSRGMLLSVTHYVDNAEQPGAPVVRPQWCPFLAEQDERAGDTPVQPPREQTCICAVVASGVRQHDERCPIHGTG